MIHPVQQFPLNGQNGRAIPQKRRPVGMTLGSDANGHILARMDKLAEEYQVVNLFDFVRIGETVGRVISLEDAHDYRSDGDISMLARDLLITQTDPDQHSLAKVYKKIVVEPLGTISKGVLGEYRIGSIGYFQGV